AGDGEECRSLRRRADGVHEGINAPLCPPRTLVQNCRAAEYRAREQTFMNNFARFLGSLALLLLSTTSGASAAAIVYNNLSAGTYNGASGRTVDGPTSFSASEQGYYSVGAAFTPASDYLLSEIDLALGDDRTGTNSYVVTINAD